MAFELTDATQFNTTASRTVKGSTRTTLLLVRIGAPTLFTGKLNVVEGVSFILD